MLWNSTGKCSPQRPCYVWWSNWKPQCLPCFWLKGAAVSSVKYVMWIAKPLGSHCFESDSVAGFRCDGCCFQEEDEMQRLSQVKDLHEDEGADNTEPTEDFRFLSVEEVMLYELSLGEMLEACSPLRSFTIPLWNLISKQPKWRLYSWPWLP